jgi:nitrate/TMAO reductase-like tetraheme cytochrome c subunit
MGGIDSRIVSHAMSLAKEFSQEYMQQIQDCIDRQKSIIYTAGKRAGRAKALLQTLGLKPYYKL